MLRNQLATASTSTQAASPPPPSAAHNTEDDWKLVESKSRKCSREGDDACRLHAEDWNAPCHDDLVLGGEGLGKSRGKVAIVCLTPLQGAKQVQSVTFRAKQGKTSKERLGTSPSTVLRRSSVVATDCKPTATVVLSVVLSIRKCSELPANKSNCASMSGSLSADAFKVIWDRDDQVYEDIYRKFAFVDGFAGVVLAQHGLGARFTLESYDAACTTAGRMGRETCEITGIPPDYMEREVAEALQALGRRLHYSHHRAEFVRGSDACYLGPTGQHRQERLRSAGGQNLDSEFAQECGYHVQAYAQHI
eukprot:1320163-Amphidinium_carterae.1